MLAIRLSRKSGEVGNVLRNENHFHVCKWFGQGGCLMNYA